jgi:ATP-dependent DNA helicase RecG
VSRVTLHTRVEDLPGITPRMGEALRGLGLTNLGRLVAHVPTRHDVIEAETTIDRIVPGRLVATRGEVTATRPVRTGRRPRFEAVVCDHTGRLDLVWFNGLFMAGRLHPGMRVRVQGKARTHGPGLQIANPRVEPIPDGPEPPAADRGVRAVYPASEDVSSVALGVVIRRALPLALPLIEDHLPDGYRRERELPELREAYRMLHTPAHEEEASAARRRLAYDELLLLQLGVHVKRAHLRGRLRAPALKWTPSIDRHIRQRLGVTLTPGQDAVVQEIAADLSRPTPANRLLQGDVGSGKTVVAVYAMLLAAASRHQASLMAPTELLAEQHYASITALLQGSRVRTALLTGGLTDQERDRTLARLASGEVDLLVGTHALLTGDVRFHSLALAVIDEQHRFGVAQRARLRASATDHDSTPHVLVMTATPIPRSLALTLFGDLDISVLTGRPAGRAPVDTRVFGPEDRGEAYEIVAGIVAQGGQAYVVVPAIDAESGEDARAVRDVTGTVEELRGAWLAGRRVEGLHGRMPRDRRERVMDAFRRGEVDVLVSTTVIEVGVDVPNAAAMVVEHAERFGLAQLHQLRGRVGRGERRSHCLLLAEASTPEAAARLDALTRSTDGFELAERDLEIRGPGELFGTRQSGLPPLRVADLMRDRDLLAMARRDAAAWVERSPLLGRPGEALVRTRLMKAYGKSLGLADVG